MISFYVICEVCGWRSEALPSAVKAVQAAKRHKDDNPHRDYEDVPLLQEGNETWR